MNKSTVMERENSSFYLSFKVEVQVMYVALALDH